MTIDFHQVTWEEGLIDRLTDLVRLAVQEDLQRGHDWTTVALVPADATAQADAVARQAGYVSGVAVGQLVLDQMDCHASWTPLVRDGERIHEGQRIGRLQGNARDLLTSERTILNILGRLSGIATLTAQYVAQTQGTHARIYDTRKTTPGWRLLEKYAVRCGGGYNHRRGLFDAVMIKDNHLAFGANPTGPGAYSPAEAVARTRQFLADLPVEAPDRAHIVEVEVDRLEQLRLVLPALPDIVLLDNMSAAQLAEGVAIRDELAPTVQLEASGGVNLDTVGEISRTGVDRISVGALTHSARCLDVGLDWSEL